MLQRFEVITANHALQLSALLKQRRQTPGPDLCINAGEEAARCGAGHNVVAAAFLQEDAQHDVDVNRHCNLNCGPAAPVRPGPWPKGTLAQARLGGWNASRVLGGPAPAASTTQFTSCCTARSMSHSARPAVADPGVAGGEGQPAGPGTTPAAQEPGRGVPELVRTTARQAQELFQLTDAMLAQLEQRLAAALEHRTGVQPEAWREQAGRRLQQCAALERDGVSRCEVGTHEGGEAHVPVVCCRVSLPVVCAQI